MDVMKHTTQHFSKWIELNQLESLTSYRSFVRGPVFDWWLCGDLDYLDDHLLRVRFSVLI